MRGMDGNRAERHSLSYTWLATATREMGPLAASSMPAAGDGPAGRTRAPATRSHPWTSSSGGPDSPAVKYRMRLPQRQSKYRS